MEEDVASVSFKEAVVCSGVDGASSSCTGTTFLGREVVAKPRAIGLSCVFFFLGAIPECTHSPPNKSSKAPKATLRQTSAVDNVSLLSYVY